MNDKAARLLGWYGLDGIYLVRGLPAVKMTVKHSLFIVNDISFSPTPILLAIILRRTSSSPKLPRTKDKTQEDMPYRPRRRPFSTAWELAEASTNYFDGSQPLTASQKQAVLRWKDFQKSHYWNPNAHLEAQHFPEIIDILSHMFFLGEFTTGSLRVRWASLPPLMCGLYRSTSHEILLNRHCAELFDSSDFAVRVLLHEMTHALLGRCQAAIDRLKHGSSKILPRKLRSAPQSVDDPDLGISGHGRAFIHVSKAIEEHMRRFLGFSGDVLGEKSLPYEVMRIIRYCQGSLRKAEPLLMPLLADLVEEPSAGEVAQLLGRLDRSGMNTDERLVKAIRRLTSRRVHPKSKIKPCRKRNRDGSGEDSKIGVRFRRSPRIAALKHEVNKS